MEVAVLDSDALIEAYDIGIEKFSGLHTTHISLYEFLRGLAYLGKKVDVVPAWKWFLHRGRGAGTPEHEEGATVALP